MNIYNGGEIVGVVMEDVIKNIIHIDKGAVKLRENLEKQVIEKKHQVNEETIRLKEEIVQTEKYSMEEIKNKEMQKARIEADDIIDSAKVKACSMYERYKQNEEDFIKEMFIEIFYK